jgi:hypothetical protein
MIGLIIHQSKASKQSNHKMTQQFILIFSILLISFQLTFQSVPIVRCSEVNALEFTAPEEILESEIFDTTLTNNVDCSDSIVCKLDCQKILPRAPENCFTNTDNLYLNLTSLVREQGGKSLYYKVCRSKRGLRTLYKNLENLIYSVGAQLYRKFVEKETGITQQEYLKKNFPTLSKQFPDIMTVHVDDETFEKLPKKTRETIRDFYRNLNIDYVTFAVTKAKRTYHKENVLKALSEYIDSFRGVIKLCDQKLSNERNAEIKETLSKTVENNLSNWIISTRKGGAWGAYKYEFLNRGEKKEFARMAGELNSIFVDTVVSDFNSHIQIERSYCYCSSFRYFLSISVNKENGQIKQIVASNLEFSNAKKLSKKIVDICRAACPKN